MLIGNWPRLIGLQLLLTKVVYLRCGRLRIVYINCTTCHTRPSRIKKLLSFFIFSSEKKNWEGFCQFLTLKNDFESQNFAVFDLQFLNDQKAQYIFMAVFVVL